MRVIGQFSQSGSRHLALGFLTIYLPLKKQTDQPMGQNYKVSRWAEHIKEGAISRQREPQHRPEQGPLRQP